MNRISWKLETLEKRKVTLTNNLEKITAKKNELEEALEEITKEINLIQYEKLSEIIAVKKITFYDLIELLEDEQKEETNDNEENSQSSNTI